MTQISTRRGITTLINVFTVEPEKQQALVDLLSRATDETMRHLPGFLSATIHKSTDGTRVTNYAQWRSQADFEAMTQNPEAQPHMKAATALAIQVDPHLYDVMIVRDAGRAPLHTAVGAAAAGALAFGACAIGALALGRVAIGMLALKRGRIGALLVDDVSIGRLAVRDLVIDRG